MSDVLLLENICKIYGKGGLVLVLVLLDLFLCVGWGEVVVLVVFLGVGKFMLLYIVGLLDMFDMGCVLLDGKDMIGQLDKVWIGVWCEVLGFVYQFYYLLLEFLVMENIVLLQLVNGVLDSGVWVWVVDLLVCVGLSYCVQYCLVQFLGGEQQCVVFCWVLVNGLKLLLVDELMGNLDLVILDWVFDVLMMLVWEIGLVVLIVMYNFDLVVCMDWVIYLDVCSV